MQFCGAEVSQSLDFETISISMEDYVKKVKPISIAKHRKTMSDDPCNDVEKKQLRALIGAVAWPANQCLPQASASTSLLQASMASPCVKDINEANKFLRYLKEATKGFKLNINSHGTLENVRFGVYTDAAWAVRPDSTSQGGYLLFVGVCYEADGGGLVLEETTKNLPKFSLGRIPGSNTSHRCSGMDKGVLGSNGMAWNFYRGGRDHEEGRKFTGFGGCEGFVRCSAQLGTWSEAFGEEDGH